MSYAKSGMWMVGTLTWALVGCAMDMGDPDGVGDAQDAMKSDQEVAAQCANKAHKQAVCHIPPGNPANAHTICIAKAAVDKHVQLHGDYLGVCDPGGGSGGGSTGDGGATSTGSGGGSTGDGGSTSTGSGGSDDSCTTATCSIDADCADGTCEQGCCVPFVY